ncbi:mitochondrial ribosomal protein L23 [Carabus blaptoides fortunei]
MEMTKHDVKNYLEKIYDIKTVDIRTRIALGKTRRDPGRGYVVKDDDVKYAYAVLPREETFEYPDIFPSDKKKQEEDDRKSLDETKKGFKNFLNRNNDRPGTPGWFSF